MFEDSTSWHSGVTSASVKTSVFRCLPKPWFSATHLQPSLKICETGVHRLYKKQKVRKAPGLDGVSPSSLRNCADQLVPVFTKIFNKSLEQCVIPACFKHFTIIPILPKTNIPGLIDYRPVALTSLVMKLFERLVLTPSKGDHQPPIGPPAVCVSGQQIYGRCSKHGTSPHSAPWTFKYICKSSVLGLQFCF